MHPTTRILWQTRARLAPARVPPRLRPWLFDEDSLTRRLLAASGGDFRVELLYQAWGRPEADEARLLGMPAGRVARLREVLLHGRGAPWVYARSVLPEASLRGPNRFLRGLDNRPLGALLFQSPDTRRTRVEYAQLPGEQVPGAIAGQRVWGRRSVFLFHGQPLLVGEYFLPVMEDSAGRVFSRR